KSRRPSSGSPVPISRAGSPATRSARSAGVTTMPSCAPCLQVWRRSPSPAIRRLVPSRTRWRVDVGYYPLFVDLADRACLVVGGGDIADGKVQGLLVAGATVTVVSPTLVASLADAARAGRIEHRPRAYRDGDLAGFALAFAATGDPTINAAVAREGRRSGVWVNAVDDPAH